MNPLYGRPGDIILGSDWPLALDQPFTARQAARCDISRDVLRRLVIEGFVYRLLQGVYAASTLCDCIDTRAAGLALVTEPTAIVTDEAAGWLFKAAVLPPNSHLRVPPLTVYQLPGNTRVRRAECVGGERTFLPRDLVRVGGVWATCPLRTALDLGRLRHRDRAIAGLDALLRLGEFTHEELLAEIPRFRGMRGVVQLRSLAPLADPRAESPSESVLRLRWLDACSLPRPTPQVPVINHRGEPIFRLDLGVPELRYAAEYDGVEFHSTEADRRHDRERRELLRTEYGWEVDVLGKANLYGARQDAEEILRRGIERSRRRLRRGPAPRK